MTRRWSIASIFKHSLTDGDTMPIAVRQSSQPSGTLLLMDWLAAQAQMKIKILEKVVS